MNKKQLFIKLLILVLGGVSVFLLSSCFTSLKILSCKQSCLESCKSCNDESTEIYGEEYGVYYTLSEDEKSYYVSKVGYKETSVVIPELYGGKPVTGIKNGAFVTETYHSSSGCSSSWGYVFPNLISLSLPRTVKVIEYGAFLDASDIATYESKCSNLYYQGTLEDWLNIDFGSSPIDDNTVLYIAGEKLTELVVPESVTVIGENAFAHYQGLTNVTFHEEITFIGKKAFESCDGLKSITLPCKDLLIEKFAFAECNGLIDVTFTGEKLSLDTDVFFRCSALREVNWTTVNITVIPEYTFYECTSLRSLVIPASVVAIRKYAFWNCVNLEEVYNLSTLDIVAGSSENGGVAQYALTVKTALEEETPPTEGNPPEGETPPTENNPPVEVTPNE